MTMEIGQFLVILVFGFDVQPLENNPKLLWVIFWPLIWQIYKIHLKTML